MNINIIVAHCQNRGIGINNKMPWYIKSDLQKFKNLTTCNNNNAIVMGSNTWKSLNCKPLPNRDNLILSSTLSNKTEHNNVKIFNSKLELYNYLAKNLYEETWVIGGEKIYQLFMNDDLFNVHYIFITYIDEEYECDTYFPIIDLNKFIFISKNIHNNNINDKLNTYDILYKNINCI